jgi:NitT/TauT family transport system ATP-binding protein
MSTGPGTIKRIIEVDLPRPRRSGDIRKSIDFSRITGVVWNLLHEGGAEKKTEEVPARPYSGVASGGELRQDLDSAAL